MKKWSLIIIIAAIIGLAIAFIMGQLLPKTRTSSSNTDVNITDPALIKQGEYIARTADASLVIPRSMARLMRAVCLC